MDDQAGLSSSMLVPYGGDYADSRQLSDYTPTSRFRLPAGWGVKEVIRADGSRSDKYYVEPGTRLKFRSMKDVERRVNEEIDTPRQRSFKEDYSKSPSNQKMIVSGGKISNLDDDQLAIVSSNLSTYNSPFDLPDGWVVERVPRRRGVGSDKYYYEPDTGRKFRSLREVERYLQAVEIKLNYHHKESDKDRLAIVSSTIEPFDLPDDWVVEEVPRRLGNYIDKNSGSSMNNISRERDQNSSFNTPPMKIDWVLASPGGDSWTPYIGEKLVPESVKQEWAKRFMLMMEKQDTN